MFVNDFASFYFQINIKIYRNYLYPIELTTIYKLAFFKVYNMYYEVRTYYFIFCSKENVTGTSETHGQPQMI